jgi:hypothetical protein
MGSATGRDGLGDGARWARRRGGMGFGAELWRRRGTGNFRVRSARDLGEILGFGAGLRKILSKICLAGTKKFPAHPLFCPLSQ